MSWLDEVVSGARRRPAVVKRRQRALRSLSAAIIGARGAGVNPIIAELKRASPSGFSSGRDALEYLREVGGMGACAVSVLTEPLYFRGSYQDLELAAGALDVPVLMKDFVVSEAQVLTGFSLGADSVLLIVRVLSDGELEGLYRLATSLGMEPLVEVHDEEDLVRAERIRPRIVGVNARDLRTLELDRRRQVRVLGMIGWGAIKVAESGVRSPQDIRELKGAGADAFLIGSALMEDPRALAELLKA